MQVRGPDATDFLVPDGQVIWGKLDAYGSAVSPTASGPNKSVVGGTGSSASRALTSLLSSHWKWDSSIAVRPALLLLILATYVWQVVVGFTVTGNRHNELAAGSTFVLVFFAIGIARSWELLGMRGGGFLDLLISLGEGRRREKAGAGTASAGPSADS